MGTCTTPVAPVYYTSAFREGAFVLVAVVWSGVCACVTNCVSARVCAVAVY